MERKYPKPSHISSWNVCDTTSEMPSFVSCKESLDTMNFSNTSLLSY